MLLKIKTINKMNYLKFFLTKKFPKINKYYSLFLYKKILT